MLVSGLGAWDTRRVADDGEKWAPGLMSSDFLWQLVATEDKHIVNIIIIITPNIRITKFVMKEKKKHEAIHTAIVKCSITISPCPEISDEVISLLPAPGPCTRVTCPCHVSAEISQYQGISPSRVP